MYLLELCLSNKAAKYKKNIWLFSFSRRYYVIISYQSTFFLNKYFFVVLSYILISKWAFFQIFVTVNSIWNHKKNPWDLCIQNCIWNRRKNIKREFAKLKTNIRVKHSQNRFFIIIPVFFFHYMWLQTKKNIFNLKQTIEIRF